MDSHKKTIGVDLRTALELLEIYLYRTVPDL